MYFIARFMLLIDVVKIDDDVGVSGKCGLPEEFLDVQQAAL